MEKDAKKKDRKSFLVRIMEIGKNMAEKSKDQNVNKEIKERANY